MAEIKVNGLRKAAVCSTGESEDGQHLSGSQHNASPRALVLLEVYQNCTDEAEDASDKESEEVSSFGRAKEQSSRWYSDDGEDERKKCMPSV